VDGAGRYDPNRLSIAFCGCGIGGFHISLQTDNDVHKKVSRSGGCILLEKMICAAANIAGKYL
jgi:hypothetical protein